MKGSRKVGHMMRNDVVPGIDLDRAAKMDSKKGGKKGDEDGKKAGKKGKKLDKHGKQGGKGGKVGKKGEVDDKKGGKKESVVMSPAQISLTMPDDGSSSGDD